MVGTVKLETLGKAAVVARASSLRSDYSVFRGSSFRGVQTPDYMAPIGQPIETLNQWPHTIIIGVGRESPPRGPCLTGQPIKNYGLGLNVLRGEGKLQLGFL